MGGFRWHYVGGALLLMVSMILTCSLPWLIRGAVAMLEGARVAGDTAAVEDAALRSQGLLIMGVALLMAAFRVGSRLCFLSASRRCAQRLRVESLGRLVELSPRFYARLSTGDLVSRLTSDVGVCQGVCGPGAMYFCQAGFLYVGSLAFMSAIDPGLTLILFLPYPLLIVAVGFAARRVKSLSALSQVAMGRLTTCVQETLAGITVVKAFATEGREAERFATENEGLLKHNMSQAIWRGVIGLAIGLGSGLASLVVLWSGGLDVVRGELAFADFVAFFGYMGLLIQPTVYLGWMTNLLARGGPAMERVQELRRARRGIESPESGAHDAPLQGRLEFRELSYRYPSPNAALADRRAALQGVSGVVESGRSLGLFGAVGSGKSTLLKAIPRLIELPEESLLVDGVAVEGWSLEALRGGMGYVPQDGAMFSLSLAENIALGRPDASRDELLEVCRLACLEADLERLPQGLDTLIGERGVMLSGGQRQRAAIARALLVMPRVVLLDDALSMVDAETASLILDNLGGALAGLTVVIAAHRTATLLRCDELMVLDEGRVIERGAPASLLSRGGLFARAHERQRLQDRLEEA